MFETVGFWWYLRFLDICVFFESVWTLSNLCSTCILVSCEISIKKWCSICLGSPECVWISWKLMCFSGGEQVFLSSCICKDLAATTLINRHLLRVSMLVTLSLYSFFLLSYVCRAQAHKLLLKILCSSPTQARRPPSAHRSVFARISHHSLTYPQSIHIYAIISTLSTPKLEKTN